MPSLSHTRSPSRSTPVALPAHGKCAEEMPGVPIFTTVARTLWMYTVLQCRTLRMSRMTTLTIRLDPKLEKALDRVAKSSGRTKSEIAREALRRQVAVARFRELRRKTLPFAEAQGLVTDEDVFHILS